MRIGVVFPQTEISADPVAVRDYAQAAEGLGYDHLLAFDQVLGLDPATRPGTYTSEHLFHEQLVLFGFLAGQTTRIELTTGILVLPQRQAVLVAKQAAEVDLLSAGRLRLGIGVGLKAAEFEALGESFGDRGRRIEEQVEVMRALWTRELVSFEGRWHRIADAGLNPLPVQRPIPIWFGGHADAVLRRVARLGDGWLPMYAPGDEVRGEIEKLRGYVRAAGRPADAIGIESWVTIADKPPEAWAAEAAAWKALGATHVSVNTMAAGLGSPDRHIDAIRRFKQAVDGL